MQVDDTRTCPCGAPIVAVSKFANPKWCLDCRQLRQRERSRTHKGTVLAADALECPVCHERFNTITAPHYKKHGYPSAEAFKRAFGLEHLKAPSVLVKCADIRRGQRHSPETLAKYKETRGTPEFRAACSQRVLAYMQEHPDRIRNQKFDRGWVFSEKADQMVYVRSSWERRVLAVLDWHQEVEEVEVEPFAIPYLFDGQPYNYVPDLLVTLAGGVQEIWEIKPKEFLRDAKTAAKIEALRQYGEEHGYNTNVLTLRDIENLERWVRPYMTVALATAEPNRR